MRKPLFPLPMERDFFISCFKPPRSEERVQGTKFLAGVWGKAPSRLGRQPNRNPRNPKIAKRFNKEARIRERSET